ncbi:MAG: amidohydrolase [Gemmatimonadota bacterium]|nr:amidohydrolase [Gemmatimonadota bacterium]
MLRRRPQGTAFATALVCGAALACAPDGDDRPATAEGSQAAARQEAPTSHPSTLVLTNGRIVTLDDDQPEATALAARDGRIVAVGSDADVAGFIGEDARVIDLEGRLAIPGFIEGHAHFMGIGNARMILDLTTAETWDDIVAQVADAAVRAEPGAWILGRGWHQEKWTETPSPAVEGLPLHDGLSAVSPDNPVSLTHASGHASFVNARALELAGIDRNTPNPDGGEIVRDADGDPTGMLRETAQGLTGAARAEAEAGRSREELLAEEREKVRLANEELLEKGITSFQDAGSSFATVELLREMADAGELPVRLYVMLRGSRASLEGRLDDVRMVGYADDHLTVRSIKQVVDGALGSHGAWLLQPYADMPSSEGLATNAPTDIEAVARLAIEHDFQVNTHAIGDRGNREVLDLYERTFADHPDRSDLRWRIEHAQHIDPADIPRFAELGVIASMQGIHACSDGPWVMLRLGEARARTGAYMWQDLAAAGAIVTNGTDAPVEDVDPIASFHCTVTRQVNDGSRFYVDQAMGRLEALRSYTYNNAYAAFEEDVKGTLEVGKLADVTVLSHDILTVPDDEILDARVLYTIVGGRVLYEDGSATP